MEVKFLDFVFTEHVKYEIQEACWERFKFS